MTEHNESISPSEKFKRFARQVISVPKEVIDRREKEYQKARAKLKRSR